MVVGLLMLLLGMLQVLYTEWFQDELRVAFVERVNTTQDVKITLDKFEVDFPLNLNIEGLSIVERQNDTLLATKKLNANVGIFPLLKGIVAVDEAKLNGGRFRLGNVDSAMMMNLKADKLNLSGAKVALKSNEIGLNIADVEDGRVDLIIKNDTTPSPTDTTESTPWKIKAQNLNLKDFGYFMSIESTIDTLNTYFVDAHVSNVNIDLGSQRIGVELLSAKELDAKYIASNDTVETVEEANEPSKPWTIEVDSIDLSKSKALYALAGVEPMPGIDFSYIQIDSVELKIASFYNQASDITIPIKWLKATERCGVELQGKGTFAINDGLIYFRQFDISTDNSQLAVDGMLGTSERIENMKLTLVGGGNVGVGDVAKMFPLYEPVFKGMPNHDKVMIDINVAGAVNDMTINKLQVDVAGRANVDAKGYVANITDFNKMRGIVDLTGEIIDADFVNAIIADDADDSFVLPVMTLSGKMNINPGIIVGAVKAHTSTGDLALDAKWNNHKEAYNVDLLMEEFPIDAFLPRMGVENVSGRLVADGQYFDPFKPNMHTDAELRIDKIKYQGVEYDDIDAKIVLKEQIAQLVAQSRNRGADFTLNANCRFDESTLEWDMNADVNAFDLHAFDLMEQRATAMAVFNSKGVLDVKNRKIRGMLQIDEVDWRSDSLNLSVKDINTKLLATDSTINMALRNKDMFAFLSTNEQFDSITTKINRVTDVVTTQIDTRKIDVEQIQRAMPRFNLDVRAGSNNLLSEYLASTEQSFKRLTLKASNDSMINVSANVLQYKMGTTAIDTINFNANQYDKILMYHASIGNKPGTLDEFARVTLDGYLADDLVSAHLQQQNIAGKEGYNIGALAQVGDSLVRFELFPETPMLAYKLWDINDDNFIEYNMATYHVDANVEMKNATSSVNIYTEHNHEHDSIGAQEDVIMKIKNLKLAELIAFNPYAPPIKGDMSADMRVNWGDGRLNGKGLLSLEDFAVGKERVGTFVADLGVTTDKSGQIKADASLMVDGEKTMTLAGYLNDSTSVSPVMLDLSVIHFPLKVLNPLLPQNIASLSGMLNGEMKIIGSSEAPIFNGSLDFDSTAVMVMMTGTPLNFSNVKIPIVDNVVSFNDFAISGVNKNPLTVNGTVDISNLSSPQIDLKLKARDMQIVGSNKSRRADVYGKGFVDFDAKVKGNLSYLDVDASVNLLGGSNVTYIIPDATSTIASYNTDDMVKFVRFSDTAVVNETQQTIEAMSINLDVALIVSEGTTINVDLSADGKNKVQLQGSGTLNYSLNELEDSRLTGRYTINKGFVRYTPPLMSEKLFNFNDGSYVAFNGDMLNPILSLSAVDNIKANVTQEGQDSRLVDFDVKLSVTNTLNNMNVAFDLSTPDDITIANELSSMSAEQRANQAMNMLLYNVYTGVNSKGNTDLSGNPLYSFVESKLNTWAANNIGFVDVSFGIDQYDKTKDGAKSKTTSYSYKVSKTLFNDRFKIVVGGNYSTDADADENFSQNLINDISFEYMLNRSGSMYVKLFRQVGFESILEGEVTQTGVGFVYKRKLSSLRDLFKKKSVVGNGK